MKKGFEIAAIWLSDLSCFYLLTFQLHDLIKNTGKGVSVGKHVDFVNKNTSDDLSRETAAVEYIKRNLRRIRTKDGPEIERLPPPGLMTTWVIPERLKYLLLWDSKALYGTHRFMVFTTAYELELITHSDDILSDGTFAVPAITDNRKTDKSQVSDSKKFFWLLFRILFLFDMYQDCKIKKGSKKHL